MMSKELLAVAKETKPADLVIQNGKIVNEIGRASCRERV